MPSGLSRVRSMLHETALSPDAWPEALKSLTNVTGAAGAAYIAFNKITGRVEWACFSGPSDGFKSAYVRHYAALDPYSPLLDASWTKLSECLPDPLLRRSEWYNDFVLASGVRDILGARLVENRSYSVIFGLHQQIGRVFSDRAGPVLSAITAPLQRAARLHIEGLPASTASAFDETEQTAKVGRRFYFHICNGRRYPDETGSIFSFPDEAVAHASMLAGELAGDGCWEGFSVAVVDEHGREIARVLI